MSSARRRAASRANGKKSHGPVTPEGKARSAANATRHGLAAPGRLADSVCLSNETPAHYVQLHEALIAEYTPATTTEHLLVEEMAVARWRLQRAWTMENALLDNQMDRMMGDLDKDYETMDETTRTTPRLPRPRREIALAPSPAALRVPPLPPIRTLPEAARRSPRN